jgi:glucose/arabinose dehydrogenase
MLRSAPRAVGFAALLILAACKPSQRDLVKSGTPPVTPREAKGTAAQDLPADAPHRAGDPCRGVALPADQHYVAPGLCARAVALHQGPLREITFLPNGDLIAVRRDGVIRRYRDVNGNGVFDDGPPESIDWARTGGSHGHNCHLDGDYLYCGTDEGVKRWPYAASMDHGGDGQDVMVGQPGGGNHPFHPVHVYDGWMYVDSGSERNTFFSLPDDYVTDRAVIKRFSLARFTPGKPFEWKDGEVFVRGARNVTGFTRDAKGRMYGVFNGLDDLRYEGDDIHQDNPAEYFARLEAGQAYGWPFCFAAQRVVAHGGVVPAGTLLHADAMYDYLPQHLVSSNKDDAWCAAHMTRPMSFVEAHSAPLDVAIFDGPDGALPARWKGGAFVSSHGSWDRLPSTGAKVVWFPLDAEGHAPMPVSTATETNFPYEVVFGGGSASQPRDGQWGWEANGVGESFVRPVGVAVSPIDGALYVSSDDQAAADNPGKLPHAVGEGAIYRIATAERLP